MRLSTHNQSEMLWPKKWITNSFFKKLFNTISSLYASVTSGQNIYTIKTHNGHIFSPFSWRTQNNNFAIKIILLNFQPSCSCS